MNLPTSLAPKTMSEAMEFSKLISQSNMVPAAYKGKPADVLVAVQWGAELGLAPLQALQNIACINGKPSVYGDAALALVRGSPVCEDVEEFIDGDGEQMVATCIAKRKGCKPVVAKFSVFDAKAAGLWKKQGPWQQYPRRMLQMRARGFALRDAFPDVLKGLITAEEAQDYPRTEKDITPVNPLEKFAAKVVEQIDTQSAVRIEDDHPPETIGVDSFPASDQPAPPQDAMEGEVIADGEEAPAARKFPLMVPGGEVVAEYHTVDAWLPAYLEMMDKVLGSRKYNARTKMTKLRELREANEGNTKHLLPEARARIMQTYTHHLRTLGAEMGDAKEGAADETV